MRNRYCWTLLAIGIALGTHRNLQALDIAGYDPALHDRFYVGQDRDFIGENFNWSGVGRTSSGVSATMVSSQYFLSASHLSPAGGATVRFYKTNVPVDCASSPNDCWEGTVDSTYGVKIDDSDLFLGRLIQVPPSWVARYPLMNRIDSTNYFTYQNPELWLVGDSPSQSATYTSMVVGKNSIDGFLTRAIQNQQTELFKFDFDSGIDHEAQGEPGDSGSPIFVNSPAGLALAGTFSQPGTATRISFYRDEIVATVIADSSGTNSVRVVSDLIGDVTGDLRVNISDLSIFGTNYGQSGKSYFEGNLNNDSAGLVNVSDLSLMGIYYGKIATAPADIEQDLDVDGDDFNLMSQHWLQYDASNSLVGDINKDGWVDIDDVDIYIANRRSDPFELPDTIPEVPGDATGDGRVGISDLSLVNSNLGEPDLSCLRRNWNFPVWALA